MPSTTPSSSSHRDLLREELELESEARTLGITRYQKHLGKGEENSAPAIRLMADVIPPLSRAIKAWYSDLHSGRANKSIRLARFLQKIPAPHKGHELIPDFDAIALIVTRSILAMVASRQTNAKTPTAAAISADIADRLEAEVFYRQFRQANKGLYQSLQKRLADSHTTSERFRRALFEGTTQRLQVFDPDTLGAQDARRLGMVLLRLATETEGAAFVAEVRRMNTSRTVRVFSLRPEILERLQQGHESCALLHPWLLPMVVPPRRWETAITGGYLDHALMKGHHLVRRATRAYLEDLETVDMPQVYQAVNRVQETAWRINRPILDIMRQVYEAGTGLGGIPVPGRKDDDIPRVPADIWAAMSDDEKRIEKRRRQNQYTQMRTDEGTRLEYLGRVFVAERMRDYDAIYFPHNLDFRGRMYPMVPYLHPQGPDQAKALLQFAEAKRLGEHGAFWLHVHIAGLFGVDKCSFEERVKWTQEHADLLLHCSIDPLGEGRFWLEADDPWQALAAAFEFAGYTMMGEDFESRIAVAQDGSCNGLQHYAAMLRDTDSGRAVNLVPAEQPADIYMLVAARVEELLLDRHDEYAQAWRGNVQRKLVKQPVMTLPYAVTQQGMRSQVKANYRKENYALIPPHLEVDKACEYLADVIHDAVGDVLSAATRGMDFLKNMARAVSRTGTPSIHWTAPTGFPVHQRNPQMKPHRVESYALGQRITMQCRVETAKPDTAKQTASIAPNYIHSMDAAHLMRSVVRASMKYGIGSFAMVHDSYGTHACDCDAMAAALRECFIEMYRGNALEEFRDELASRLAEPVDLPEVPEQGDLDVREVALSSYFFA